MQSNPWDILSQNIFRTHPKEDAIDPESADNILLAWPPILTLLEEHYPQTKGVKILDYGCGAGGFCNKLDSLGFDVTGIDSSAGMIKSAKLCSSQNIRYLHGNQTKLSSNEMFNTITSIMTFPFIKSVTEVFEKLVSLLNPSGLFIIVVFNPNWVTESLKHNMWFSNFDSIENPKVGWKIFGELNTPIYIRNAKEYTTIAKRFHLQRVLLESPIFTQAFVQKYPDYYPNNVSEYIILGFQKE